MKLSKRTKIILYVIAAVVLASGTIDVALAFFTRDGCRTYLLGMMLLSMPALLYLVLRGGYVLYMGLFLGTHYTKFWARSTAISLLVVCSVLPIVPRSKTMLAGYYLRVKTYGDIPAILAWVDQYPIATSQPTSCPTSDSMSEWEKTHRQLYEKDLPEAARPFGWGGTMLMPESVLHIRNGGGSLTVGHGVGNSPEAKEGWRISDDAYVWEHE